MTARSVAVKILCSTEKGGYSNIVSDTAINSAELSLSDAALVSRIVYGVLQRKLTLDYIIGRCCDKGTGGIHPFVLNVLRVGIYQIYFMDKIPPSAAVNEAVKTVKSGKQKFAAGFVNAVLRRAGREKEQIISAIKSDSSPEVKYSCPRALYNEIEADYGTDTADAYFEASLESPETYIAVNLLKTDDNELTVKLNDSGVTAEKTSIPGMIRISNPGSIEKIPSFSKGLFFVQDAASQNAVKALSIEKGMSVLDVCAAPGGKSFLAAIYAGETGRVVSCDLYESRTKLIKGGAMRLGLGNVEVKVNDASKYDPNLGTFDRVICDVPCTGTGVLRRKPEIKYKDLADTSDLACIQLGILNKSKEYVKPGGLIMYSTCSVRSAENERITEKFLGENADFESVEKKTLMPQTDGTDGFFYHVMKRVR